MSGDRCKACGQASHAPVASCAAKTPDQIKLDDYRATIRRALRATEYTGAPSATMLAEVRTILRGAPE